MITDVLLTIDFGSANTGYRAFVRVKQFYISINYSRPLSGPIIIVEKIQYHIILNIVSLDNSFWKAGAINHFIDIVVSA